MKRHISAVRELNQGGTAASSSTRDTGFAASTRFCSPRTQQRLVKAGKEERFNSTLCSPVYSLSSFMHCLRHVSSSSFFRPSSIPCTQKWTGRWLVAKPWVINLYIYMDGHIRCTIRIHHEFLTKMIQKPFEVAFCFKRERRRKTLHYVMTACLGRASVRYELWFSDSDDQRK